MREEIRSVKDWMMELVRIRNIYLKEKDFSEKISALNFFIDGRIQIFKGIELMAKATDQKIEFKQHGEWVEKTFIYRGVEFFELSKETNK